MLWVVFRYFVYQKELETHNNSKILMFFGVCVYNHGLGFGLTCSFLKIHVFTFCPWKNQVFVHFCFVSTSHQLFIKKRYPVLLHTKITLDHAFQEEKDD